MPNQTLQLTASTPQLSFIVRRERKDKEDKDLNINFSRHAKRQMKWRKLSEEEAKNTIIDSENVEDSINNRKNAFKHINGKWIKVTYKVEDGLIVVVTVVDKNN